MNAASAPATVESLRWTFLLDKTDDIAACRHRPMAVYHEAAVGRTGTMLATYLISQGESAASAISRVRAAERSAVETPRQIQFLEQFAQQRQPGSS